MKKCRWQTGLTKFNAGLQHGGGFGLTAGLIPLSIKTHSYDTLQGPKSSKSAKAMITNAHLVQQLKKLGQSNREALPRLKIIRSSAITASEGIVISHVRDEMELLPHFLKHYREIGVKRFVFVDNGSVDQTLPFLLDQADCDVFQFSGGFKESAAGTVWKNLLLLTYLPAKWYLGVDADEHAVYEGWPNIGWDEFVNRMSLKGRSAITALMVDMYSGGPVAKARIQPARNLLETCSYFDGDGYRVMRPENWRTDDFPRLCAFGGPMDRLFGKENGHGWLAKTPLILEPNIYFIDPHTVLPVGLNFTPIEIALLHFRLSSVLVQKTALVMNRPGYTKESLDIYQKIAGKLQQNPEFGFSYSGSVKFESPQQFVDRSMIGQGSLAL